MKKNNKKVKCDKCSKIQRTKYVVWMKGKLLCSNCKPKINVGNSRPKITLEDALNTIYEVKGYYRRDGKLNNSSISMPSVLIGYKIKISLVSGNPNI